MNAYELHKSLINQYISYYGGSTKDFKRDTSKDKTDLDVIRENHKFLWDDVDADTWGKKLAKRYYDKLFKEYTICDLSRYKENKVALRWRTRQEVVVGKGQFICGTKKCEIRDELRTWEVNFAYIEDNEKKNALVKLRLCPDCSVKLNYKSKKREIKRLKSSKKIKKLSKTSEATKEKISIKNKTDQESESDKEIDKEPSSSSGTENPWTKSQVIEEKSREDEIDEYLEMLLL
uniref:Protein fra10ac1 log isoform x2 plutella xylostella n=1 Tax=Xenopsylla cheopis TaxID=163159 RepID=A0A6M2DGY9_XENCH